MRGVWVATVDLPWTDQLVGLGLVALAAVLGAVLGLERSFSDKPAGLRTHMLVSGTAAALVWAGAEVLAASEGSGGDPNRALHAVITGIGFVGAGTILRLPRDHAIVGLTTAASLLFAAAVGVVVGSGLVVLGVGLTVVGVVVLQLLGRLDPAGRAHGTMPEEGADADVAEDEADGGR